MPESGAGSWGISTCFLLPCEVGGLELLEGEADPGRGGAAKRRRWWPLQVGWWVGARAREWKATRRGFDRGHAEAANGEGGESPAAVCCCCSAAAAVLLCGGREGRCRWERRLPTGYRRSLTVSGSEWRVSPRVCLPALVRWASTALLGSADRDSERGRVPDPAPGVPVPGAVSPRSPPASSLLWSDRTSTATTTPTATQRRSC